MKRGGGKSLQIRGKSLEILEAEAWQPGEPGTRLSLRARPRAEPRREREPKPPAGGERRRLSPPFLSLFFRLFLFRIRFSVFFFLLSLFLKRGGHHRQSGAKKRTKKNKGRKRAPESVKRGGNLRHIQRRILQEEKEKKKRGKKGRLGFTPACLGHPGWVGNRATLSLEGLQLLLKPATFTAGRALGSFRQRGCPERFPEGRPPHGLSSGPEAPGDPDRPRRIRRPPPGASRTDAEQMPNRRPGGGGGGGGGKEGRDWQGREVRGGKRKRARLQFEPVRSHAQV